MDCLQYNFRDWIFGSYFCRVTNFMTHMSIIASVLTMAAIAMERYSLHLTLALSMLYQICIFRTF